MDGKKVIVVVIFLFFSVNIAKAEDFTGKKVTVPKFTPSGKKAQKEKWLKVGLADMILNDIAATGKLEVVPRRALEKIMEEQKIQQSGAINKKTAVKIGKMVGADLLVSGNYQLIENYIRINTTVYDVEKGVSVGAANVSGNVNEVFKLEKLLVTKLLKNLDLSLSQEEKINFFRTSSQNLKALEKNYKGELAREKGNKKQPEEFRKGS
ncbi:MAG: CsgG/HfaB family protein [Flavobacteriales bacterium]